MQQNSHKVSLDSFKHIIAYILYSHVTKYYSRMPENM